MKLTVPIITTIMILMIVPNIFGTTNPPQLMVPGDENWIQFGGGPVGDEIFDMATDGSNVYIVGPFTQAGSVNVSGLAKWDGYNWSAVGDAVFDNAVYAVACMGNDVYVGGAFDAVNGITVNGIAKWDGTQWSSLGTGSGTVRTIEIDGTDVYIGGVFGSAGGVSTFNVAKWNGSAWSGFAGTDLFEWQIEAIEVIGTDVYAGGYNPYSSNITYIKKWDGNTWVDLDSGVNGKVLSLATDGTNLYVGGEFYMAGTVQASRIAKWDGSQWSEIGGGLFWGYIWDNAIQDYQMLSRVMSIVIDGSDIIIGGGFQQAGGVNVRGVAKWNGSQWINMGADAYYVNDMEMCGGNLYVGGQIFDGGGMTDVGHIMFWNGAQWKALGNGLDDVVHCMEAGPGGLYVAGLFWSGGGAAMYHIGRWDGSTWHSFYPGMLPGIYGDVNAIKTIGTDVYAGGSFGSAGGVLAENITFWDGTSFNAMGSGINGTVHALVSDGINLYAGGEFHLAGGTAVQNIAKWDGLTWTNIGNINGLVYALAHDGTYLYAGGKFTLAGSASVNNIARWNGTSWSGLGNGVYGEVSPDPMGMCFNWDYWSNIEPHVAVLAFSAGNIYAGGYFETADGITVNHIARWDGSSWHALGDGIDLIHTMYDFCEYQPAQVNDITISGNIVYASGRFQGNIKQWNGSTWSNLGSGCSKMGWDTTEPVVLENIKAIAAYGNNVYVGGSLTEVGGQPTSYFAAWNTTGVGPDPSQFSSFVPTVSGPVVTDGGSSMGCAWGDYNNDGNVDLFIANDLNENNSLYQNNGDGTFTKITTGPVVTDGGVSWSGSWGDYDNDGNLDLYVTNLLGDNMLYQNNGNGLFTKITTDDIVTATGSSRGCSWCDYDNDGDLDLFVANGANENNFLFNNNGDGTFTQVTTGPVVTDGGHSTAGVWADIDLDNDMDLFVTNTSAQNNCLYTNNGDGTFTKVTTGSHITDGGESWTASWGDTDNDGDMDLYVGNNGEANFFYTNTGDGTFTKMTSGILVTGTEHTRSSTCGDVNNDGRLDLIASNRNEDSYVYLNEGGGSFARYYTAAANSRGVALCDYNGDGDLDLCAVNDGANNTLYANSGNAYHWVQIQCQGTVSNHSAIGARLRVQATIQGTPTSQTRIIGSQTGFGGENNLIASFGLRDATTIDVLEVYWPSGQITTMNNLDVDQVHTIIEGTPNAISHKLENLPDTYALERNYPNPFNPETIIPYALPEQTQVTMKIFDLTGREIKTLINQHQSAGWYQAKWDGTNQRGARVATGIYIYQLQTTAFQKSRKMIHLR
ncbi:FG-GAP-like repeat-containing protein [bacterium]